MAFPRSAALMLAFLSVLFLPLGAIAGEYDQSLLWRIERDGVAPSHLLGTMHSDDRRVLTLPTKTERAFREAEHLAIELKLEAATLVAVQQLMRLPPGPRLPELLGEPLWQRTQKALAQRSLPAQAMVAFQPWAIALTLSMPPASGPVLDYQLAERAAARGLAVSGLEQPEEQLDLFTRMTPAQQRQFLDDTLQMIEQGRMTEFFERMTERYVAGDMPGLLALVEQMNALGGDEQLTEQLMHELIDVRNRRMAERMQPLLAEGGAFVAIGAMHLPGEQGVLALLVEQGWRVAPVLD